jgi:hypothetical protein
MYEQHEHDPRTASASPGAFVAPRLELPRFQFRPATPAAGEPVPHAPRAATAPPPRPAYPPHQHYVAAQAARPSTPAYAAPSHVPVPPRAGGGALLAPLQPQLQPQPQPVPTWQANSTAHAAPVAIAVAPAAAAPAPLTPAAIAMSNSTIPTSSVAWSAPPTDDRRGLLQRITPVHMGVLMAIAMVMVVMTAGPASMTAKPAKLPAATVNGGGIGVGGVPVPARAGTVAIGAASAEGGKAGAAPRGAKPRASSARPARAAALRAARTLPVGSSARVRANVRAGGIPSPAAAANLAVAGGGRVSAAQTSTVRMNGIPSPAAAEQLGPQKLPFRPTDGVTLPRVTGERDSHAVDQHYGADTLPMETPAAPAITPGAAAAAAERANTMQQLANGSATPPAPASGQVWAF